MLRRLLGGWKGSVFIALSMCCVACSASAKPAGVGSVPSSANTGTPSRMSAVGTPQSTVAPNTTATKGPIAHPTSTRPPVATTPPSPLSQDFIRRAIARTNSYRQLHGCAPLTENAQLDQAALGHSQDMAIHNYFAHDSPSGQTPWDRIHAAGYSFSVAAENIAAGYATPEAVIDAFYNEQPPNDGHRRNLLNCALHEVGIGYYVYSNSQYRTYWTQDLGTRA
jgi:uncharacterized protein YkwD